MREEKVTKSKNSALQGSENCEYFIDIIELLRIMDLTNTLTCVYSVPKMTRKQMQNNLIQRPFWHTSEHYDSMIAHHPF
jgi:hypothetical protein